MADIPFTTFSFIGLLLCIFPAYFNWKIPGRPWATLIFIGWIFALNLFAFIDSIIWRSSDPADWWDGRGYCDISSRIKYEFQIGLPAAGIGICRFLADATDPDPKHTGLKHTRVRRNIIDLSLGVGLPLINMALKMFVQPVRYLIVGVSGCTGRTDDSWPAILLYYLWCPLLSTIAAIYAVIFVRHWWKRRQHLNEEWTRGMRSGISQTEFRRLQFTILLVIFFYLPFSWYTFGRNIDVRRTPYSLATTMSGWNIILMQPFPKAQFEWMGPALAITSFMLVGTTRNARMFYSSCIEFASDHLPKRLVPARMRSVADSCKQRRTAGAVLTGNDTQNISMIERYNLEDVADQSPTHRKAARPAKNWFDAEDDGDDAKSLHSSESTLAGQDDKSNAACLGNYGPTAHVTANTGPVASWPGGIYVTRQVVVETRSR